MNTANRLKVSSLIKEYLLIIIGSILYAVSTVLFIFPNSLVLGGTSGISVILEALTHFPAGNILMIISYSLIVLAFFVLGKEMATKTLFGSVLTAGFVGIFENLFALEQAPISNCYLSAAVGAAIIAVASGIMFYVDSSSGGTDIIALIIKKFSDIKIGKALLITDFLIVIVGGIVSGVTVLLSSFFGLLIKTFGIDFVIALIKKYRTE